MKISIITACYNSEKTIKDTLESVLSQNYMDYEHIIVDGKSSDNTLKIVRKYEDLYQGRLRIISERDRGLYDAMNKGIVQATGDVIGILNSDDKYADKTVLDTIATTIDSEGCDGIYGDLEFRNYSDMTNVTRIWKSGYGRYKLGWHPPHPTLYLKRKLYQRIGLFDLNFPICSDYDFMLRMMQVPARLYYIQKVLIHMRSGGVSTAGLKGYMANFKESYQVLKKNQIPCALGVNVIRTGKTVGQMIKSKFKNRR